MIHSMSKDISELLEIAIKERYPELSEQVEKALAKK
jgi:disulfide oxidoreductase YuzD